eukprot:198370-Pelagomonas_calceolata.AAC.2
MCGDAVEGGKGAKLVARPCRCAACMRDVYERGKMHSLNEMARWADVSAGEDKGRQAHCLLLQMCVQPVYETARWNRLIGRKNDPMLVICFCRHSAFVRHSAVAN